VTFNLLEPAGHQPQIHLLAPMATTCTINIHRYTQPDSWQWFHHNTIPQMQEGGSTGVTVGYTSKLEGTCKSAHLHQVKKI